MKINTRRKRVAISELVGTLLMVAVTLVAGAAVFSWINGQAGTSETAYGNSVASNINYLREHFVVVAQSFAANPPTTSLACSTVGGTSPNYECTLLTLWPFDSGQSPFTLYSVRVQNLTDMPSTATNKNPLNAVFYAGSTSATNLGFVEYSKTGTTAICSGTGAWNSGSFLTTLQPGFYLFQSPATYNMPSTVPVGQLTAYPYEITMPTAATCSAAGAQYYLYDGIAYTLTFTGLYGNVVSTTVTVNG